MAGVDGAEDTWCKDRDCMCGTRKVGFSGFNWFIGFNWGTIGARPEAAGRGDEATEARVD